MAAGAVSYIVLSLIAASALPEGFSDWPEYISSIGTLEGSKAMPVFYAMDSAGGSGGMLILGISLISAILTGIIGSTTASSRLLYSMSKDNILPGFFGKLSKNGIPKNAVLFLLLVSLVIPFLGRTAIGWVVDVITVGTTIAYAYTSAAAFSHAKKSSDKKIMFTGAAGVVISAVIALLLLIPDLVAGNALSAESYLLLAFWGILGIVMFRVIFVRGINRRFGESTVVWLALLFLIFFTSLMWVRQATDKRMQEVIENVSEYYSGEMEEAGAQTDEQRSEEETQYLASQMDMISGTLTRNSLIQMILIMLSLVIVFNIYRVMTRREKDMEAQKIKAEESSRAKSAFLSNMSHDIRTPMNAIIGYAELAKDETLTAEDIRGYIGKIEGSSRHLLSLINDILEMSRIESGKMDLELVRTDLRTVLDEVRDMFFTQMSEKKISYTVSTEDITDNSVMCDKHRLDRVLLNLISNSYKFTPSGGAVSVKMRQTGREGEKAFYELRVKDSGIGMSPEFAERVFEAFERERTSTVSGIQGTGLGMAITKSIIDLMGGTVRVETAPGKGSEFILEFSFDICEQPEESAAPADTAGKAESASEEKKENGDGGKKEVNFSGMRLLLTDDVMINREIAAKILARFGFTVDTAENGQEALDKVTACEPGYYRAVLMDIQMPVMDGYEATRRIRALEDRELASIPVIAMTANAFAEDVQKSKEAGMNAHVAKPIDINELHKTLTEILG